MVEASTAFSPFGPVDKISSVPDEEDVVDDDTTASLESAEADAVSDEPVADEEASVDDELAAVEDAADDEFPAEDVDAVDDPQAPSPAASIADKITATVFFFTSFSPSKSFLFLLNFSIASHYTKYICYI